MKSYKNRHLSFKKAVFSLTALIILFSVNACKDDYLEDGSITDGSIHEEQVWENDAYARGVLNNAYFSVPEGYDIDGNGGMLASGSDEAVSSGVNTTLSIFNNGTWGPQRVVDDQYENLYEGLRKVNLFMENLNKSKIIATDGLSVEEDKSRLKGQAFFLRALFHYELVKRYGAVTLATRVFNRNENLNLPKNSYKECVTQILLDCDSALNTKLPLWTGESSSDSKYAWRSGDKGRATKTAAMALKSRMMLYAASPLFATESEITWQQAADAAKVIIDLKKHSLQSSYYSIFNYGSAPYNNEVIFATRAQNRNDIEQDNAPIGYDGARGRTNPTQEMVNAFETTNGKLVTDSDNTLYNANDPYANRDPRLALTVNYNGRSFKGRAVETFIGGLDGLNKNVNATKTGYYMRKFLSEAASWNQSSNSLARRPWVISRYAEILLNYAEALNEAQGTTALAEILKSINEVRGRSGVAMPALQTTNPTANGYVEPTKDSLRVKIHHERQVELCFEGHRFYDVRRWKEGEKFFDKPVTGVRIVKDANGAFSYNNFVVENRVFEPKNYLYPFSQNTINKQPAVVQNTGY